MAKGIRVNQLAKELGVESKQILEKCRNEGLGDTVKNHMATLSIGLAETVREWFHAGGGGTAVETAAPVKVAAKPRTSRKKTVVAAEDDGGRNPAESSTMTITAPRDMEEHVTAESANFDAVAFQPETIADAPVEAPPAPAMESPVAQTPAAHAAPSPEIVPPAAPPTPAAAPEAPVIAAEATQPLAPKEPPLAPHEVRPVPMRPTVTLDNRPGQHDRPAPHKIQRLVPEPAKIQGPRVVREEKPDVVPAPRPRRPIGGGGPGGSPSFTQARPMAGRGVRTTEEEAAEEEKKKKGARTLSSRRRGPDGRRGEAMEKLKEYTEADLIERRDRLNAAAAHRTAFDSHLKKSVGRGQHELAKSVVQRGDPVGVEEPITVRSLAAALGVKTNDLIGKLMRQGVFANINQAWATDSAEMLAMEYGLELRIIRQMSLEDELMEEFEQRQADPADLLPRPPVVTILGHVDHGKTSLLDKIRSANVAAGEAGGITQHTAAWTVQLGDKRVTFIDTPGHQAFTSMRARGANMTDVVVLVVSAAEGVQPQTVESINHARAAEVPIVVAMNKIDRPDANADMVMGQLAKENLNPVEWGGETELIRTSATTGIGIPELIEILDYQAELLDLKYDPTAPARGAIIESRVDEGLGAIATVLVQEGVLKLGDIILSGPGYGRIRALINDRGEQVAEAPAGTPIMVSGLSVLPGAGDKFYVLDDFDRARSIAEERAGLSRQSQLAQLSRVTADNLLATMKAGDIQTINLIIKGDVQGSVETLVNTIGDASTDEVRSRVIHSGVGPINESDVSLAIATKGKPTDNKVAIIGFHVTTEEAARVLAEQNHIDVKLYRVIYEIFDDLKKALSGMLAPEEREKLHGHVEIRQVFKVSKLGNIGGCYVTDGHIQRGSKIRLIRNGTIIAQDLAMESLKRVKDDVREVKQGLECGIKLAGYDDIKVGDVLEAYVRETFERTL